MSEDPKALFVTQSVARAGWYRCVLPAMYSGNDWASVAGSPPGLTLMSSWVHEQTMEPAFGEYDVVVLQQVRDDSWASFIRKLRKNGVKVLYEIDDFVHGIRHADDHDFRSFYQKDHLRKMEVCMRACDGLVVSTDLLAEKYRRLARDRPIWVCRNGLDMGRYRLSRPSRGEIDGHESVTTLWAGATGHQRTTIPWVRQVAFVMNKIPYTTFVSVGQDFASLLKEQFPSRTISVPWSALESYPAAMTLGDVVIAPAGKSDWARSKSTLRAMEAAALGIPVIADRFYEEAVTDGETGLLVGNVSGVARALMRLVEDRELRHRMGDAARARAYSEFDMKVRVDQWKKALAEAVDA